MGRLASWQVSDEFWERVEPLIPQHQRDPDKVYKKTLVQITDEPAQSGVFADWVHAAKTAAQISGVVCP